MSLTVYRMWDSLGKLIQDGHGDARIMVREVDDIRAAALEPTPARVTDGDGVHADAVLLGCYGKTFKEARK